MTGAIAILTEYSTLIQALLFFGLCGAVSSTIASHCGRQELRWFCWGFLLGPIGAIIAMYLLVVGKSKS